MGQRNATTLISKQANALRESGHHSRQQSPGHLMDSVIVRTRIGPREGAQLTEAHAVKDVAEVVRGLRRVGKTPVGRAAALIYVVRTSSLPGNNGPAHRLNGDDASEGPEAAKRPWYQRSLTYTSCRASKIYSLGVADPRMLCLERLKEDASMLRKSRFQLPKSSKGPWPARTCRPALAGSPPSSS